MLLKILQVYVHSRSIKQFGAVDESAAYLPLLPSINQSVSQSVSQSVFLLSHNVFYSIGNRSNNLICDY